MTFRLLPVLSAVPPSGAQADPCWDSRALHTTNRSLESVARIFFWDTSNYSFFPTLEYHCLHSARFSNSLHNLSDAFPSFPPLMNSESTSRPLGQNHSRPILRFDKTTTATKSMHFEPQFTPAFATSSFHFAPVSDIFFYCLLHQHRKINNPPKCSPPPPRMRVGIRRPSRWDLYF